MGTVSASAKTATKPRTFGGKPGKFGRQSGTEAKQTYKARTELLVLIEKVQNVKCLVDELLPDGKSVADLDADARLRLRKCSGVLNQLSIDLDKISMDSVSGNGGLGLKDECHKRNSITDWPTKQANETKRIRKKCAGQIESLLDRL